MTTMLNARTNALATTTLPTALRRFAIATLLLAGLLCAQRSAADSLGGATGISLTPINDTPAAISARPDADIALSVSKQRDGQGLPGETVDWTVSGPGDATLSPEHASTSAKTSTGVAGTASTVFHAKTPGQYVVIATSQKNPGCLGDGCAAYISTRFNLDVTEAAPSGGGGSGADKHTTAVVVAAVVAGAAIIAAANNGGHEHEQTSTPPPPVTHALNVVSGNGQSAAANAALTIPLVVNASNNNVGAASVVILWTASGGATLHATQSFTDANGNASVRVDDVGPGPGPVTVTATRSDDPSASATFTINVITPDLQLVSGNNQTGFTSTQVANPLVVEALLGGSPQSNVPMTWAVASGDASIVSVSNGGHSDASGLSSAVVHFGATPGPVTITATRNDGSGLSQSFMLTSILVRTLEMVSGDNQSGAPNQALAEPLVVHATTNDADASGVTINWTASNGATLSSSSTVTDGSGQASVTIINMGSSLGPVIVTATRADDLSATVQFRENINAPTLSVVSGDNQVGLIGTAATATLDVELEDGGGVPMVGQTVNWSVVSGSATLASSTAVTDSNGYAPVSFTYGSAAGPIVFQASAFGGVATVQMHATAATADSLTKISGDAQAGAPGTSLPSPLTVQITPPAGATVLSGVPIQFTVISGSASVSNSSVLTDASGQAGTTLNLGLTPGPVTVLAQVSGGGPSATFTETVTGTLVSGDLTIVSGDSQTIAPNSASAPLVVQLKGNGTPLVGQTIDWSSSGGTLSASSTTTDANGKAQITLTPTAAGTVTVTASFPGYAQYTAASVQFTENTTLATIPGLTTNDQQVGAALDSACSTLQSTPNPTQQQLDLLNQCLALNASSGVSQSTVARAIDQMNPKVAETQAATAHTAVNAQFVNVAGRLSALRGGAHGANFGGLAFVDANGSLPLYDVGQAVLGLDDKSKQDSDSGFSRWGFFGSGTIGRESGDARNATPGYDLNVHGLTFGVDYRFTDQFVFGGAVGWTHQGTNLDGGVGSLKMDGWSLTAYGTWYQKNNWYLDGSVNWSHNNFDSKRAIVYTLPLPGGGSTSVNQLATASSGGSGFAGSLTFGRDFNSGAWNYGLYGKLQYSHQDFDAFSESTLSGVAGSGLGLHVGSRTENSSNTVLGGKIDYTRSTSWGVFIPHAEFEWQHDFHSDPSAFTAFFLDDPTATPILIRGDKLDVNYFRLGVGASFVFTQGRSGFILYNRSIGRSGITQDTLNIGFRMEF